MRPVRFLTYPPGVHTQLEPDGLTELAIFFSTDGVGLLWEVAKAHPG